MHLVGILFPHTLPEFGKLSLAVSRIEAKVPVRLATQTYSALCTTPHHTSLVRAEGIVQGKSNTTVSTQSHSKNSGNTIVSGVNTCNASGCNVSVNNIPDISCNGNVKRYLWQFLMAVLT